WAHDILADPRRSPPLKVHQLMVHTRGELQRRQPASAASASGVTLTQFDATAAIVETQASLLAAARSVYLTDEPPLRIKPCDLAGVDLMVAEIDGLQEYRAQAGGWQRHPAPRLALPPVHLARAPDEPITLAVLSNPLRAGPVARLNLRTDAHAICDPRVHPEVVHQNAQGRLAWKGRDAARLSLALYAATPEPGIVRGIAATTAPDVQTVNVTTCGMRDVGAPFGDLAIGLQVLPATQWWTEVRHAAWPAMHWPATGEIEAPTVTSCRLEADGAARDVQAWQKGWAGLRAALAQGMEKMFNTWSRAMSGGAPRLEVQAELLSGGATITWGYRRTAANMAELRVDGVIDMIAAALDVHLSGELDIGGARARIHLSTKGRSELRMPVQQMGAQGDEAKTLAAAQRSWRLPFMLEVEPIATAELTTLSAAPAPAELLGALSGKCGLRPRPDGLGHQWFCSVLLEPATAVLVGRDPIIGAATHTLALLPALPLVDWSAG
ncbi:MAG TPA: hypothetical protein VKI18_02075, partial [Albitalea sp.]|nr:hypothetical protein [Albitalea sp.]